MLDELFELSPFSLNHSEKQRYILPILKELTKHHYDDCKAYHNILDALSINVDDVKNISDIPFIPVRLFKQYELYSVPKENITRIQSSSGTSGQVTSKIFLDRYTASLQGKTLAKIVGDFLGKKRMPMLIVDSPDVVKDRTKFSTRGAGILGFSVFGMHPVYALNEDMTINREGLEEFLEKNKGEHIFLFGFTFIIWKHFLLELENLKAEGTSFDLSNGVMIHGGGWKKLQSEAVSKEEFRQRFLNVCGLKNIYENYGMAEQTGSIFMECECGHLHCSNFSDIIMRDAKTLQPVSFGDKGIMQVMSVLPYSYPGHSLLTEDEGIILGEDDCPCGRKGKYFKIIGRLPKAEIRGCSDTYAANISR